jgi:hypothetical protein
MQPSGIRRERRSPWLLPVLLVACAALLRFPGLWTDLWIDEIWSIHNVAAARSWLDLVLGTRIDNNHHLNSLYLYALGEQSSPAIYRLLAFVSGIGTVAMAWAIGARESRRTAIVTALVFGSSYAMVFYSSEARGYATVVWLTLTAWYILLRYADSPTPGLATAFTACCLLGVMAHQTFVLFFAGAFFWFDAHSERARGSIRAATRSTWRLFAPPAILVGVFYAAAILGQQIGGGPPYQAVTVIAQALSALSGGPLSGPGLWIVAVLVACVLGTAIVDAYRTRDDRWIAWVSVGVVVPAIIVTARQPPTLSPRYFLVPAAMLLLAACAWLSKQIAAGHWKSLAAAALIAAHVAAGISHSLGAGASRGHYRAALQQVIASSTDDPITLGSADVYSGRDFRNGLLVDHYSRALNAAQRIRYVKADEFARSSSQWVIVESLGEPARPTVVDSAGRMFTLQGTYLSGDLSGTTWYLYRQSPSGGSSTFAIRPQRTVEGSIEFTDCGVANGGGGQTGPVTRHWRHMAMRTS